MNRKIARFGPYEFDFDEMVLRRSGEPVPLQPQPTQVLAALLEEPGRLVGREELKQKVWADRVVEFDAGLNFSINQVRRALGDSASDPEHIQTVHRRGYRFVGEVQFAKPEQARSASRFRRPVLRAAALLVIAGGAVALFGRFRSDRVDDLSRLPLSLRPTFRAAQWLYERGERAEALVRLDSLRLAEPGFAPGWALTSLARGIRDLSGARAAAERAIDLDPELADAHFALGQTAFFEVRGEESLQRLGDAVRLDSRNVKFRQWYAQALANQLRFDEAIRQLEEARAIDPISNLVGVDLAMIYIAADRLDEAITYCTESLELVKDARQWARDCLLAAHHFRDEDLLATQHAMEMMRLLDATPAEVASIRAVEDYFRWDLARIDRLEESVSPFERIRATARLQDRDETLRGIRLLRETRHFSIQWVPRDPWFRFLYGDADFQALMREAGLPARLPLEA